MSVFPDVAKEWDYYRNDKLPDDYLPSSNQYVNWICPVGHSYSARINNRTRSHKKGSGCPFCSGKKVLLGFNDLQTLYPDIASQWHFEKNGSLMPDMVTYKSNRRVWWHCNVCNSDWQAKIYHRVEGHNCPYCSGLYAIPGKTDVLTLYPGIENLWDSSLNEDCKLENCLPRSKHKAYWTCSKGHTYYSSMATVTRAWDRSLNRNQLEHTLQAGCPVCNHSRRIVPGENDLESQAPWLMSEWDYDRNCVMPNEIAVHSNLLIYWHCEKGHIWRASPNNRTVTGCPICNANRLCPGENSLDVVDPVLSAQWSEKNYPVTPHDVTAYNNHKYLWRCSESHEWEATVANRHLGEGCPYCTHRLPVKGENDLKTLFPTIAEEFVPELNEGKLPEDYLPFSSKRITWRCENGHTWAATIYSRTLCGSGCPKCKKKRSTYRRTI